jgi:hypothetical protein
MNKKRQNEFREGLDRLARRMIDAQSWQEHTEAAETYSAVESALKILGQHHLLRDSKALLRDQLSETMMRLMGFADIEELRAAAGDDR